MRSVIDPISRIEGHLRVEMEVENGAVTEAWVTGGLFRGMELILEGREPGDAAYIAQRICGVCPISHANASCFATEAAMGVELSEGARLVRNIVELSQFAHSHILWFYNLAGLDYVDPTNALNADVSSAYDLAYQAGTGMSDFKGVAEHLKSFIENGQLSIFSGNWFSREGYSLPAELDLIATTHYLEALEYQAIASQISSIVGGKMPHIMSSTPGGTTFVPTLDKIDDILMRATKLKEWVAGTLLPDALAIVPYYTRGLNYGKGCGRYLAWGVFDDPTHEMTNRYLPGGVIGDSGKLAAPDESLISEYTGHSFYATDQTLHPRQGVTDPQWPDAGPDLNGKYSWCKSPHYDGQVYEAGSLSRVLVAYMSGHKRIRELVDSALKTLEIPGQINALKSTVGRVAARAIETVYITELLESQTQELINAMAGADLSFFTQPKGVTGEGAGMWEAPRGALYHYAKLDSGKISKYQIIIPTTWNIAPRDAKGVPGPLEQALIGVPVDDPEKPIDALRTVHAFDPCVACAVHVSEPSSGKHFEVVTNPWGVK